MQVTVVGQGYVGLPLAIAAAKAGFKVFGLDTDEVKIASLNSGKSPILDVSEEDVNNCLSTKKFEPTSHFGVIAKSEIIIICVPTPTHLDGTPDLSFLLSAVKEVGIKLRKGSLVVIESTIAPGTCQNVLTPILISQSGLDAEDFYLAYSPERIDPANSTWTINNTPKLLAGTSERAVKLAYKFYDKFVDTIEVCSSIEIAETAKLLENSFRLINISFINEMLIFCQKLGVDVNEVIKAASTKPYGFLPFYPSVGVGGHCIPIDPLYLSRKALEIGSPMKLIDLATQVNNGMPNYWIQIAEKRLDNLHNKEILVIGVAYKPNVSDVRQSPANSLILGLREKGAIVSWHDDLVKEWNGSKSVNLSDNFDLAILATPHDYLDLTKLGNVPILNTRSSI